ncbi:MAG TPA: LPS assembly protein LptD [Methylomirabilota bacterium]
MRTLGVLAFVWLLAGVLAAAPAAGQTTSPTVVRTPGGEVTILADQIEEVGPDDLVIASGNVEVTRGGQRLLADRAEVNRTTGDTVAEGHVIFYDGEDRLQADRIEYNFRTGSGVVHQGSAHTAPYYRVDGERMDRMGEGRYRVTKGMFTTCEGESPTWAFRFRSGEADLEELVWGTGASFWVKSLPLIPFFPYFAAAVRRERQTGFLFPRLGSSSRKGYFAEVPFFWAISDSQDALITLDAYEKRGLGASLEYRYVLSREHSGSISGFYLNEFWRPDDEQAGFTDNRAWWSIKDNWALPRGWTLRTDINGVSDDSVFREYADRLHDRSLQRVESNVFLQKAWDNWNFVGNLFWYQDLTQSRPVELDRLPDLRLDAMPHPVPGTLGKLGLLYEVQSSAVNFVREVGADGVRLDARSQLTRPIPLQGFLTVTPFAAGRLTGYNTTVTGSRTTLNGGLVVQTTDDDPRLRTIYEVGTDVESRVSRVYELGDVAGVEALLHSIEPRVNFTWLDGSEDVLRYRRDGTLPTNRLPQYDQVDAIPEAARFTYSLTNRIRARTVAPPDTEAYRWELLRFVLANTYETLNPTRPVGPITGELIVNPNRIFSFHGTSSYDVYASALETATTDLALNVKPVVATVGTRYDRPNNVHFLQGTLKADVTRWATVRAETNWDLRADVFVENRFGLDLKFQCWAFTVEYVSRSNNEDELRFALNLLGVGAPITTGTRLGGVSTPGGGGGTSR